MEPLALDFARWAAIYGWTTKSLRSFQVERGIPDEDIRRRWPRGVRSAGEELNSIADAEMVAAFEGRGIPPLSALMMLRFAKNASLKQAVRALAHSDAWHPVGVFRRTWRTARSMQSLRGETGRLPCAVIVVFYSWAVLVWLLDETEDIRWTRRTVRVLTFMMGRR